ncbi:hypothetical protein [Aliarcobacter cryaerophilus]|uniref:hypothetical protein n=1 Tax=Aliarcobacter cryaerophilus TaxID=28198 RepID=UPI0021B4FB9B|nr:hypothetical protein [Aliarcobacter cryaerophilus]MCT7497859.1 hypothetical protein [Aliarcobacter cryaerophilus]
MNKLYGSLIFFFYFFKYPIVIYVLFCYYKDIEVPLVMDILGVISLFLIIKDMISLKKR